MAKESFAERFSKIFNDNKLNQTVASELTGISQPVISNLVNNKIDKKYQDFDKVLNICENDEQKFYLATGKHLQQTPPQQTPNCINEMRMLTDTIKDLSHIIMHLSAKMDNLSAEMRAMREVSTHQGELLEHLKIPDP